MKCVHVICVTVTKHIYISHLKQHVTILVNIGKSLILCQLGTCVTVLSETFMSILNDAFMSVLSDPCVSVLTDTCMSVHSDTCVSVRSDMFVSS